jgi:hypothetical protein
MLKFQFLRLKLIMSQVIKWLKRPEAKTDSVKGKSVKKKQNFSFPGTDIL